MVTDHGMIILWGNDHALGVFRTNSNPCENCIYTSLLKPFISASPPIQVSCASVRRGANVLSSPFFIEQKTKGKEIQDEQFCIFQDLARQV